MASILYTIYVTLLVSPYLFLFFGTWIAASLARPVLFLTVLAVLSKPGAALRKLEIFVETLKYLLFCKDKQWKAPKTDPAVYFENKSDADMDKKTIIFVRHGESTWNDTFNKGDRKTLSFIQGFIPGIIKAVLVEWYFWITGQETESWFYDAPLSKKGLKQAQAIHEYLSTVKVEFMPHKEKEILKILLGQDGGNDSAENGNHNDDNNDDNDNDSSMRTRTRGGPKSQLVSSNLRRAITTMAVGFADRLKKSRETDLVVGRDCEDQILLLPELQEISWNPDALCITPAYTVPTLAFTDPRGIQKTFQQQINVKFHTGNKNITQHGLHRLWAFCRMVFNESVIPTYKSSVICAGHSLWFRSFFQTFLPYTFEHVSKKKKLQNGGIVAFTLQRTKMDHGGDKKDDDDDDNNNDNEEYAYLIDPKSIVVIHGGF